MFQSLQKWLLPYHCVLCHESSHQAMDLCHRCETELPNSKQSCYRCARPLALTPISLSHTMPLCCGQCLKKPPFFDSTLSVCSYHSNIRHLITQFKFQQKLYCGRILSQLMIKMLQKQPRAVDSILAVPLHRHRLRRRGFNQALELAKPIARHFNIPIIDNDCYRIKETAPQSELPANKRRRNVAHAFAMGAIVPQRVAIVDDVVTTGHTVNELSRILKMAGAESVQIWCLAR